MTDLISVAAPFFGLIGLGFLSGKVWATDELALRWLNAFVIYFALPALLYQAISKAPLDELINWRFVFVTTLAAYIAFAIAFTIAAIRDKGDLTEATIQGLVGGYANIGYMGPPLAVLALGSDAVVPAALIFCFEIALCFTLAHLLLLAFGGKRGNGFKTLAPVPIKITLHPLLIATVLGFAGATWQIQLPGFLDQIVSFLQSAAIPTALFALGVTLAIRPTKGYQQELPGLIAVKLILHPVIVYVLLSWIGGFDRLWIFTAVLMASLPPATTIYVLAAEHNVYVLRASSAILYGAICSVLTVTGVLYLILNDLLPRDLISSIAELALFQ